MDDIQKKRWAKWMGWQVWENNKGFQKSEKGMDFILPSRWNPDSPDCPDSVWQEIYKRMGEIKNAGMTREYTFALYKILGLGREYSEVAHWNMFHTTTPEIRCKALDEIIPK